MPTIDVTKLTTKEVVKEMKRLRNKKQDPYLKSVERKIFIKHLN